MNAITEYRQTVLEVLDQQIETLADAKQLDYKPVNLERGSYVDGTLSFGSLVLDLVTGGGAPPGKMIDVYGPEGSGKSTLVGHTIASALGLDPLSAGVQIPTLFYDHECGTDPIYFRNLGVRFKNPDGSPNRYFRYFQADNGTSTYAHINRIVRALPDWEPDANGCRPRPALLIAIDSLDAMLAGEYVINDEENRRGVQARMHGDGLRLIKGALGRKNVTLLCTNQLKLSPGVTFGNPEYEPGGQAIRFYPDLKIRLSAVGQMWPERGRSLRYINVRTIKNKQFVPFRVLSNQIQTAPAIAFGRGFERGYDGWAYLLSTQQVISSGTSWYTLDMPGSQWHKKKLKWLGLMSLCCTNEFRKYCRGQIEDGTAFQYYFNAQQIEVGGVDLEDAGDASEANGPYKDETVDEDGVVSDDSEEPELEEGAVREISDEEELGATVRV